jgi:pimeloyl-ACP methyl ester carboxylesterase
VFAKSRSYSIHFEVEGEGAPLVLHGFPMWAELWNERGYVDQLAAGFTTIRIDLLGHGTSDKPHSADAYGLPNLAADVAAVLDAVAAEKAHVWGYSMGAAVAEALTVLYPQRVISLTFGGNAPACRQS